MPCTNGFCTSKFRAKVAAGALETQALLVPEPVDLAADEAAAVLEHQELLAKIGVKVEPFGGDTVPGGQLSRDPG